MKYEDRDAYHHRAGSDCARCAAADGRSPTYVELVNAVRRLHDVTNGRRYYERVIRSDDSPALHEPRALVAVAAEIADLCRRIGPVPAEPREFCAEQERYVTKSDHDEYHGAPVREPIPTSASWDVESDRP